MLKRGYGEGHDISNGTVRTVGDLTDITDKKNSKSTKECCDAVKELITQFLNRMIYYFETKNYIFVHSWIPCKAKYNYDIDSSKPWYLYDKTYEYRKDWRAANEAEWEEARWGNPFKFAKEGLNKTGKTIVFGHWHTSWPRAYYEGQPEFGEGADFRPYFGDDIIGLDACTAHTGKVNVLVIEDDLIIE
jgi:hypothetical protein